MRMIKNKRVTLFWSVDANSMDVYFNFEPSLAMMYLSKVLVANGFDVTVIDPNFIIPHKEFVSNPQKVLKQLLEITESTNPNILGIGSWVNAMSFVAEFTREFKTRNPDVPIILGGINATHLPNETLQLLPHIDFCVRGEGENTMLELCNTLSSNRQNLGKIKGISFRNKERKIVHTPDRPQIKNLDELPLVDLECYYTIPKKISFPIQFQRGCQFKCSFCSINAMWKKSRFFSPNYIVKQIKHAISLNSEVNFTFYSDNLFSNVDLAKKVTKLVHNNFPDLKYAAEIRLEPISEKLMVYMSQTGLAYAYVGVESIIPESLLFFNKTSNPQWYIRKIPKVLEILSKTNIYSELSFITGVPSETICELQNLIEFIVQIREKYKNIGCNWSPLKIFPGTKLWDDFQKRKFEVEKITDDGMLNNPFAEKYSHLIWMVPELWSIKNNTMSLDEEINIRKEFRSKIGYGHDFEKKRWKS